MSALPRWLPWHRCGRSPHRPPCKRAERPVHIDFRVCVQGARSTVTHRDSGVVKFEDWFRSELDLDFGTLAATEIASLDRLAGDYGQRLWSSLRSLADLAEPQDSLASAWGWWLRGCHEATDWLEQTSGGGRICRSIVK